MYFFLQQGTVLRCLQHAAEAGVERRGEALLQQNDDIKKISVFCLFCFLEFLNRITCLITNCHCIIEVWFGLGD